MNRVKNKVALVTGGAVGIGRACAELLAAEGALVAVSDVDAERGAEVARQIHQSTGSGIFIKHDVSRETEWTSTIAEVLSRFKRLDILVNNAGVALAKDVEHTTVEEWRWLMGINLEGVFFGTKYAIEPMRRGGGGSIINLSSIEGLIGDPNLAAYNASKGAVRLFTKSAALYCAKSGSKVRVNSVHPGYIWTPMVENYARSLGDLDATRRALDALHPVGHIGEVMDIAYGVLYLASDEAKFVTGAELVIDGGYTAQ
jgi:NAD(P)-dependent dehydrogenase (short-subunit alcohol dehydrogenase family)